MPQSSVLAMSHISAHGLVAATLKHSVVAATKTFEVAPCLPQGSTQILGAVVGHSLVLSALDSSSSPLKTLFLTFEDDVRVFAVHPSARFVALTLENKKLLIVSLMDHDAAPQDTVPRISGWKVLYTGGVPKKASSLQWADDSSLMYADKFGTIYSQKFETSETTSGIVASGEPAMPLGHYSVVTDMIMIPAEGANGGYIATCDKDEKIRVSRWPHAYDIVSYCMGHSQYVTTLALIRNEQQKLDALVSGGGDGKIFVWNYLSGVALAEVDLAPYVPQQSQLFSTLHSHHHTSQISPTSIVYNSANNLLIVSVEFFESLLLFRPSNIEGKVTLSYISSVKLPILPLRLSIDQVSKNLLFVAGVPIEAASESAIQVFNISGDSLSQNTEMTAKVKEATKQETLLLTPELAERTFVINAQEENLKKNMPKRGGVTHSGTVGEHARKQAKLAEEQ